MPLCIQIRASSSPRAARVWAASFSWWGNSRSEPPPWMSKPTRKLLLRHRRALDVPARPPGTPRRRPEGVLALLAGLPQREVERVALAIRALHGLALVHVLQAAVGQRAVVRVGAHAEEHVPVALVGVAPLDQRLDVVDDRAHRLRGQRLLVGAAQLQRVGVGRSSARSSPRPARRWDASAPARRRRSCR